MIYKFSKKKKNLSKNEINEILKIKNSFWNYGLKSHKNWFKKNIHKDDIHNIIKINHKIVGYTLLRNRKIISLNYKKFFYLDTLIIKKNERKKNYSKILMNLNNKIIKNNKKISFLICTKKKIKFYKKFGWKLLNKKKFKVLDFNFKTSGMIYNNFKKVSLDNLKFFLYRKK